MKIVFDNIVFGLQKSGGVSTLWYELLKRFEPFEKEFTTRMLSYLIDEERIKDMSPYDAIRDFTMEYPTHIYDLALSNTQSRRSRAGKEFESILELLMMGAGIPVDVQGAIGKSFFQKNQIPFPPSENSRHFFKKKHPPSLYLTPH